jgi:hypothetical protein
MYVVMHGTNVIAEVMLNIDPTNRNVIHSGGVSMDSDNQYMKVLNGAKDLAQA